MKRDRRAKRPARTPAAPGVPAASVSLRDAPGRWLVFAVLGAMLAVYGGWMVHRHVSDPGFVFLVDDGPAKWICFDQAVDPRVHAAGPVTRAFRTRISIGSVPGDATLRIRALKRWNVLLDGRVVGGLDSDYLHWKNEYRVPLPLLTPGEHELTINVQNDTGPVAVRARCEPLGLATDTRWESTQDGQTWIPARLASTRPPSALSRQFEPVSVAFASRLPLWLSIFALVAGTTYYWTRVPTVRGIAVSPAAVRWLIMGLWVVLGLNNMFKLPAPAGFDVSGHLEYVSYLINHQRVPLATDGWQLFQSPLYYALTAPLYLLFAQVASAGDAMLLLRGISLLAGALQIELGFRAARHVFPERRDLQILGTMFAGFLPMNIYLSQYVGNEPLASALGSLVVFLALKHLSAPDGPVEKRPLIVMGAIFGLALLTKVSAVILTAPLLFVIIERALRFGRGGGDIVPRVAKSGVLVFGPALIVAGWYYIRNWIHLGRPFVGGWDPNRGIPWWQDPGYRVPEDLLRFGDALVHPVYAGMVSFWDGLYATFWSDSFISSAVELSFRPPWNYPYLLSSLWLALLPTVALILGAVQAVRNSSEQRRLLLFALICAGAYLAALGQHFLTQPYYSAIKAFYTLGAMPCYTVLAAVGFDLLGRHVLVRPLLHGGIAAWAVSVYVAYFAR